MTLYKATLFASAALVTVQALVIDTPSVYSSEAGGGDGQPSWYHPSDHPTHALFRRQNGIPTDGHDYPAVGSSAWSSAYPQSTPDAGSMPQEWKDALNAAVQAGKIPDLPLSIIGSDGNPYYPGGLDPNGDEVCSGTYKCRIDGELWDAPNGHIGISFDDGPLPGSSDKLYSFMQENGVHGTHFYIGTNILWNYNEFLTAFQDLGDDIAVHTWTHPYMTTLSNEDVLAELAWTMQIIHDSTGGRIPRFWRPPYGDVDKRVFAIAQEVLGLTTVLWNRDSEDWSISTGATTLPDVVYAISQWVNGTQSPGLMILEHELTDDTVSAFMQTYPFMVDHAWAITSVAQLDGQDKPYQNAKGSTGEVWYVENVA